MRLGTPFYLYRGGEVLLLSSLWRGREPSGYCCRTVSSEPLEDGLQYRANRHEKGNWPFLWWPFQNCIIILSLFCIVFSHKVCFVSTSFCKFLKNDNNMLLKIPLYSINEQCYAVRAPPRKFWTSGNLYHQSGELWEGQPDEPVRFHRNMLNMTTTSKHSFMLKYHIMFWNCQHLRAISLVCAANCFVRFRKTLKRHPENSQM